jgi:hypothetical protein
MSNRLKIMACGAVERIEDNILDEMQVQVFDSITKKYYNVDCNLVGEPEDGDTYEINVYSVEKGQLIDTCRMDSSGGIFMDEDFSYAEIDDDLGSEIIELMIEYFIVPF